MNASEYRELRFTQLHLENWRNFSHVRVELNRRVFLVGPNASGKSNFLDVFRFLRDLVSVGGGFQQAVLARGGVSRLRCLAARRYSDIVIWARIGNDEHPRLWEYELRFSQDRQRIPTIRKERVARNGEDILARPDAEDSSDPQRLTQTYLEQVYVNQPFRDMVTFLDSVRYLHLVPQLVREPDRTVVRQDDSLGSDFLEQIAKTPKRTHMARLKRIREALQIAVPQLQELELWRDERGTPHLRGKYEHWRPQGAWQTEDDFSDGTLRLMGLLWSVLSGDGPLLLEEPELSLHPGVVRHIPQLFARVQHRSKRQLLVSTHSPELLQDEGIGLDETFLLHPDAGGTQVESAHAMAEIRELVASGLSVAEAIMPKTEPPRAYQLSLFGS